MMTFENRQQAGARLATALARFHGEDVVVLGLPRGGVPIAAEIARTLEAPLDVIIVRKLGVPFHPELAMGAIGEGDVRVVDEDVMRTLGVTRVQLDVVEARERAELERRAIRYRAGRAPTPITGRTAIIVDDGVATGSTARAACRVARAAGAARVVFAAPVGALESVEELRRVADEVVCLETPSPFYAVGEWYVDFRATTDEEVEAHLRRGRRVDGEEIAIPLARGGTLSGSLEVPDGPRGLVVFAHGSGSSRNSPRNRWVARFLDDAGLATLLFDLLTPSEQHNRAHVFDIQLLGDRLAEVTRWLRSQPTVAALPIGYFGASTGAAAALWAAAEGDLDIRAIVSRGGRPDLALPRVRDVRAPTLLIVGGNDTTVLELNRRIVPHMRTECRLVTVPGATHLFEEPGTLRAAAGLARDWFLEHLAGGRRLMERLRDSG